MARIGLILMLVSLITGGMFYFWDSQDKSEPAIAVAPLKTTAGAQKDKPVTKNDVNFNPYIADLQRRIKKGWFPPKSNDSDKIELVFKVHMNGSISNLRLTKPSKLARANQAAFNAVKNATPVRPLPIGAPDNVDVQFTFEYNVSKK